MGSIRGQATTPTPGYIKEPFKVADAGFFKTALSTKESPEGKNKEVAAAACILPKTSFLTS